LSQQPIRELVQRLEKLERDRDWTVKALREGDSASITQLLAALRAFPGVTRYKRGDLEIELSQGKPDPEQVDSAEPWPDKDGHRPCPICGMFANLHYRGSVLLGCDKCHEREPLPEPRSTGAGAPPADEQPPVEIDMAAVEEKLREQDAKRRGTPVQ
jgi:hypothetical protein